MPTTATGYTLAGPSSGPFNLQSGLFTIQLSPSGGQTASSVAYALSATGGLSGGFTPVSADTAANTPDAATTFRFAPTALTAGTITVTNNQGLTNPAPFAFTPIPYPVVEYGFMGSIPCNHQYKVITNGSGGPLPPGGIFSWSVQVLNSVGTLLGQYTLGDTATSQTEYHRSLVSDCPIVPDAHGVKITPTQFPTNGDFDIVFPSVPGSMAISIDEDFETYVAGLLASHSASYPVTIICGFELRSILTPATLVTSGDEQWFSGAFTIPNASPNPSPPIPGTSPICGGQISITAPSVDGAFAYNLYRSAVSGGPYTLIATSDMPSFVDMPPSLYTTYYYVMTAVFPKGESDYSAEVSAQANTVPSIPTSLIAVSQDDHATLTWSNPHTTLYDLYRDGIRILHNTTAEAYVDINVVNGQEYDYQLSATNVCGTSALSAVVPCVPQCCKSEYTGSTVDCGGYSSAAPLTNSWGRQNCP